MHLAFYPTSRESARREKHRKVFSKATSDGQIPQVASTAHVTWGESEIAPVLHTHILADSDLWNLSDDERNEITYQQNKDRPLHDIVNQERQAYTALLEAVQMLSDEDLNDPHRFKHMPQEWRPWQLIAGNSFKHYEDHMPSIRQWLAKQS